MQQPELLARRPRTARPHRVLMALAIFLVTLGSLATAGALYGKATLAKIDKLSLGGVLTPFANAGMGPATVENYLLVGSDSRAALNPDGPPPPGQTTEALPTGRRSDTIMVLRFDPATNSSALLSIPRDLYVEIAGTGHKDKINSAFNRGPDVLIRTVQSQLGIPIHHYVEVDFEGFQRLVDAVGGVPVWFDHPSRDKNTGLNVNGPACVNLNGIQALQYARSRYFEQQINGKWETDGTADLGRISRQQDFMRRAFEKALGKGTSNPAVAAQLIQAAVANLRIDDKLDVWGLGNRLRQLGAGNLTTYTVAGDPKVLGGQAVLVLDRAQAQPVLDYFAGRTRTVATTVAPAKRSNSQATTTAEPVTTPPQAAQPTPPPTRKPVGTVPDPSKTCG